MTAAIIAVNLATKLLADAKSMADVREHELGEQSELTTALEALPSSMSDIKSGEPFAQACIGCLWCCFEFF